MIDIHTHILPGVDDGARDMEEAIQMLKNISLQGIKVVILTPHVESNVQRISSSKYNEIFQKLIIEAEKNEIDIKLILGAEVKYKPNRLHEYTKYTIGDSKYILIEFSTTNEDPIEEVCYSLKTMGLKPIIAHIERYPYLKIDEIQTLKQEGVFIQVNISGLTGNDGAKAKKRALKLKKLGLIDYIASDCHGVLKRKPDYSKYKPEGKNLF